MSAHVKHHHGGVVELSADFICAMAMFGEGQTPEAKKQKSVLTPKPVKAKKTNWKNKK